MLHNIIYMNMVGNGRGVGITEMLHGQVEVLIVALFAVITQLGDVWFLFLLGSILYVAGDAIPRWGSIVDGVVRPRTRDHVHCPHRSPQNIFVLPRPPGAGEPPVYSGFHRYWKCCLTIRQPRPVPDFRADTRSGAR